MKIINLTSASSSFCRSLRSRFLWRAPRSGRAQSDLEEDRHAVKCGSAAQSRASGEREPLERQRAAEELARMGAVEQRKLVEGYRLQEEMRAYGWRSTGRSIGWARPRRSSQSCARSTAVAAIRLVLPETARRPRAALHLSRPRQAGGACLSARSAFQPGNAGTAGRLAPSPTSLRPTHRRCREGCHTRNQLREAQSQAQPTRPRRTGKPAETNETEDTAIEENPERNLRHSFAIVGSRLRPVNRSCLLCLSSRI